MWPGAMPRKPSGSSTTPAPNVEAGEIDDARVAQLEALSNLAEEDLRRVTRGTVARRPRGGPSLHTVHNRRRRAEPPPRLFP